MKKKKIIFGIFIVFICLFFVGCKSNNNSNITSDNYFTMIEVLVSDGPNFSLVIDKDNKVSHVLFLNSSSTFIVDSKIENKDISKAISIFMEDIWDKDYFNDNQNIELINYGNSGVYNNFYQEINKNLVILGINGSVVRTDSTLDKKASLLGISYNSDLEFLNELKKRSNDLVKE